MFSLIVRPRSRTQSDDNDLAIELAHLRAAVAASDVVYCLVGMKGAVLHITANAHVVLGEAAERAAELGLSFTELMQAEEPAVLEAWYKKLKPNTMTAELKLRTRAAAEPRWVHVRMKGVLPVVQGTGFMIEISDVTAQVAEAETAAITRSALDDLADAIYITDTAGQFLYVNHSFERLSGFPRATLLGNTPALLKSGRHRAEFYERMWTTLQDGGVFTAEVVNRRADGGLYTVDLTITPLRDESGIVTRFVAVARDITERKRAELHIEDVAYFDTLTGLANQRLLRERSRQMLALARRHRTTAALLHIDIAQLRAINEAHGRTAGDAALRAVAERLRLGLRESDTLARLASDEFLILLSEVADEEAIARVVRRLHESMCAPFPLHGTDVAIEARIGVALYPQDAKTFDELLDCAETALQRAQKGRTAFEFYQHDFSVASHDRLSLEDDLDWAWEHDQFVLHYQPILNLASGRMAGAEALTRGEMAGVEALARWPHLERGLLAPSEFIPLAERTGRILSLDRWALDSAIRQSAAWAVGGWQGWVAVNLSARSLQDPELSAYVARTLADHGADPTRLVVEVTESTAMRDAPTTARVLHKLRDTGVMVALDDFGIGHSSLSYLKHFPVDLLKLDSSFINDIGGAPRDEHLIEVMISLAHHIGAQVVAEGVEREEQVDWLKKVGCDYVQGFLVGRPVPADALARSMTQD